MLSKFFKDNILPFLIEMEIIGMYNGCNFMVMRYLC